MKKIRVTVWNEFYHERQDEQIAKVYPKGIHGAIAEMLEKLDEDNILEIRTATLDMPECGLSDEVLNNTDVLLWWGHMKHGDVPDALAEKIRLRVLQDGMGFIPLHSGHLSKPFVKLMGTVCRSKWHDDQKERIWVIDPSHPIARNLPEYIELPLEEVYGERFEIPAPDELVFISWFSSGEVFRSGCCYHRGMGKVFYFRPGHEAYPTYYRKEIAQILYNAVLWAQPSGGPRPKLGKSEPLENTSKAD